MTTPRIEEMLAEFERNHPGTMKSLVGLEVRNFLVTALTEAKQAGIDEAVEMLKQNVVGRFGVEQMMALDDTIKALQNKK